MNKYKVIYYLSIYSCVYRKSFGYDSYLVGLQLLKVNTSFGLT